MVGVGRKELLDKIAVRAVKFHAVDTRFLATYRAVYELTDNFFDFPMAQSAHSAACKITRFTLRRGHRRQCDIMFRHKRRDFRRDVEQRFGETLEHSCHCDTQGYCADCKTDVLTSGVMQLHEKFCAVFVYTLCKLVKTRNLIVVACAELRERRRTVHVVYTGDFGDDKPRTALCAFLVVVHKLLGDATVELTEAHKHRRHNDTVFNFAITYFHR